jgi:hypothetical protein
VRASLWTYVDTVATHARICKLIEGTSNKEWEPEGGGGGGLLHLSAAGYLAIGPYVLSSMVEYGEYNEYGEGRAPPRS